MLLMELIVLIVLNSGEPAACLNTESPEPMLPDSEHFAIRILRRNRRRRLGEFFRPDGNAAAFHNALRFTHAFGEPKLMNQIGNRYLAVAQNGGRDYRLRRIDRLFAFAEGADEVFVCLFRQLRAVIERNDFLSETSLGVSRVYVELSQFFDFRNRNIRAK